MASRAQIERLSKRIDVLVDRAKAKRPRLVAQIIQEVGETVEQAKGRHFKERPEDRAATEFVIVKIVDVPSDVNFAPARRERQT